MGRTDFLEAKNVAKSGRASETDLSLILIILILTDFYTLLIRKMCLISNLVRQ